MATRDYTGSRDDYYERKSHKEWEEWGAQFGLEISLSNGLVGASFKTSSGVAFYVPYEARSRIQAILNGYIVAAKAADKALEKEQKYKDEIERLKKNIRNMWYRRKLKQEAS